MRIYRYSREEIARLPYVRAIPRDGRIVPLINFFDSEGGDWHLYVPHGEEQLIRLADGELISGSYLGRAAADARRDVALSLGTLICQHLSFTGTLAVLGKLENDIHRCAASLEKYHLLWVHRHDDTPLLVESEAEYLLFLLRSLYDLLQNMVRELCERLVRADDPTRRIIQPLPESFRKVVMENRELRTAEAIVERFGLPQPLARWYEAEGPFFRALRRLRDGIAHHGHRVSTIYATDWGFAVAPTEPPWDSFAAAWPESQERNGRLGSLRSGFVYLIWETIQATNRLAEIIPTFVTLSPAIGEDLQFLVRSPFGHQLTSLEAMRSQPWEGKAVEREGIPD